MPLSNLEKVNLKIAKGRTEIGLVKKCLLRRIAVDPDIDIPDTLVKTLDNLDAQFVATKKDLKPELRLDDRCLARARLGIRAVAIRGPAWGPPWPPG